jgi:SHS2 domain found in N terminus of Rpb7p/Rpc25p/MJ0397
MFFLLTLERVITLHPSFFNQNIREYISTKLLQDVEGTCTGQYYIVLVLDSFDVSEGRIVPGSAVAEFNITYKAICFRPFKGETVSMGEHTSNFPFTFNLPGIQERPFRWLGLLSVVASLIIPPELLSVFAGGACRS